MCGDSCQFFTSHREFPPNNGLWVCSILCIKPPHVKCKTSGVRCWFISTIKKKLAGLHCWKNKGRAWVRQTSTCCPEGNYTLLPRKCVVTSPKAVGHWQRGKWVWQRGTKWLANGGPGMWTWDKNNLTDPIWREHATQAPISFPVFLPLWPNCSLEWLNDFARDWNQRIPCGTSDKLDIQREVFRKLTLKLTACGPQTDVLTQAHKSERGLERKYSRMQDEIFCMMHDILED